MTKKKDAGGDGAWLEQAYPEVHYLLLALEGDEGSLEWLRGNSKGVGVLAGAMTGRKRALAELHADEPAELDDLFEVIDNEDLCDWLQKRRPDVHLLVEAIKGSADAKAKLKRKRPALARLALVIHDMHEAYEQKTRDGTAALEGHAASDVGCLIGEMHLKAGEYDKAVEAFTRAIESGPAPDLYEERARAYRGLAARDERRAAELRGQQH